MGFQLLLNFFVVHACLSLALGAYKAAVYEHAVIFPPDRTTVLRRKQALGVMVKNIDVYAVQVKAAAAQGAKIIVFPEYGLYGLGWTRQTIEPYLEYIPDPKLISWNPCDNPRMYNDTDVQQRLSCMAKSSGIYVVANMGGKQPCLKSDPNCPDDGHFQYSTTVVYNTEGKVIARYFKQNLFFNETHFDRPRKNELVTFDTPFGRFGIMTSFDIMFHDPAISLVEQLNVTNIVFPAAWKDELPLMAAIEFHSAFAQGVHVNLLSANLHLPAQNYHGSGLYWPAGTSFDGLYYYNETIDSPGSLLVCNVTPFINDWLGTSKNFKSPVLKFQNGNARKLSMHVPTTLKFLNKNAIQKNSTESLGTFKNELFHDLFTFLPLRQSSGNPKVCQGKLCCEAGYEVSDFQNGDLYAIGAFDGLHTYHGKYYLQVCAFIKCANNSEKSCGAPTKVGTSYVDKMSFLGNFTTKYVYPEVLTYYDGQLNLVTRTWLYQESIIIDVGLPGNAVSIAIFGRDYSRD